MVLPFVIKPKLHDYLPKRTSYVLIEVQRITGILWIRVSNTPMAMIVAEISPASKHDRLLTVIEGSASVGRKFSTFNADFNWGILLPRSRYVFILNDVRFFVKFTFLLHYHETLCPDRRSGAGASLQTTSPLNRQT